MNLKWLILGALAYHMLTKKKDTATGAPAIKAPTQEELIAAANAQAKKALEQAQEILSTI